MKARQSWFPPVLLTISPDHKDQLLLNNTPSSKNIPHRDHPDVKTLITLDTCHLFQMGQLIFQRYTEKNIQNQLKKLSDAQAKANFAIT